SRAISGQGDDCRLRLSAAMSLRAGPHASGGLHAFERLSRVRAAKGPEFEPMCAVAACPGPISQLVVHQVLGPGHAVPVVPSRSTSLACPLLGTIDLARATKLRGDC